MKEKLVHLLIIGLTGFTGLTAIGGGIALLAGLEGGRFPIEWLAGTPFTAYTIPALLLILAVGGSSMLALVLNISRSKFGAVGSIAAGIVLVGFITGEILLLKQTPPGPTPIEIFYLGLGFLTILLPVLSGRKIFI